MSISPSLSAMSQSSPDTEPVRFLRPLTHGLPGLAVALTPADFAALGYNHAVSPDAATVALQYPVYLCGAASSSMDVARALIQRKEKTEKTEESPLPPWGSVLASCQTSGKGQLGRAWVSPLGNIYAALRLPAFAPLLPQRRRLPWAVWWPRRSQTSATPCA